MEQNKCNIDQYNYIWSDYNYCLIENDSGYSIVKKEKQKLTFIVIENDDENSKIINMMLENGNPIYKSLDDMKSNKNTINVIGEKTIRKEFSVKKYNVFVEWSKELPYLDQIKTLKKVFPEMLYYTNIELLESAWNCKRLLLFSTYLNMTECQENINKGKKYNITIILEAC